MKKIFFRKAKPHICGSEEITKAVIRDLQLRLGMKKHYVIDGVSLFLDFGGCIVQGAKTITSPSGVSFFAQHFSLVKNAFRSASLRDGLYYKIHGTDALCLDPITYSVTLDWIMMAVKDLSVEEDLATQDLLNRLAKIKSYPR